MVCSLFFYFEHMEQLTQLHNYGWLKRGGALGFGDVNNRIKKRFGYGHNKEMEFKGIRHQKKGRTKHPIKLYPMKSDMFGNYIITQRYEKINL